jgi:hypothetical protein
MFPPGYFLRIGAKGCRGMAKTPEKIELHPDAWARFERGADVVVKSPPQHRVAKKAKAKAKPKKKASK